MIKYLLIAVSAFLISGYFYRHTQPVLTKWRRMSLFILRSFSIAIILLLILSPILYFIRQRTESPRVIVLRDVSQSMELTSGSKTKKALMDDKLSPILQNYKAKAYSIVQYDFADGLSGNLDNTLLQPVLNQIASDHKLSQITSIILASDGWLKDESLLGISQMNLPFIVLADSSASDAADLQILGTRTARFAYRNEPTLFQADVLALNAGGRVKVNLMVSDKPIAEKSLELSPGSVQTVEFVHRFPQTGLFDYRIEISSQEIQERSLNNNRYPGAIEVLSEKEKIYLISDQPGWDNKFIIDAISLNPRWDVTHLSVREEQLYSENKAYREFANSKPSVMIIINNGTLRLGSSLAEQIKQIANRGSGILYQGLPIAELQDILPLRQSNITRSYQGFLSWKPEANSYPMLSISSDEMRRIPPIDYFYTVANPGAVTAVTIDNPQSSAAIAFQSLANRRSVALSFLNLWRWQMQSPQSVYQTMISNLIVWLSNTGQSGFDPIYSRSYFLGESISIRLRSEDDIRQTRTNISPRIQIFDARDNMVFDDFMAFENEQFRINTSLNKSGQYRFNISDQESGRRTEGRFVISEGSLEERDYDFNLPLLAWLAYETGGELIIDPSQHTPPPASSRSIISRDELALYRKWYILLSFILAFSLELYLRRRWGLL